MDLARRFALGGAARLSDGPVARGRQGGVWRLDTAEGSWAVKVPFVPSSEEEVRAATAFHEAVHYRGSGGPGTVSRRGHFSMLIAQLGHLTELAARDWLRPNVRSPERAGSAGWIIEVLDEPHTRGAGVPLACGVKGAGPPLHGPRVVRCRPRTRLAGGDLVATAEGVHPWTGAWAPRGSGGEQPRPADPEERAMGGSAVRRRSWAEVVLAGTGAVLAVVASTVVAAPARVELRRPVEPALAHEASGGDGR